MGDRLIAAISAYKGAPMLIDAFLLERDAPTTPPGLEGFLTPMYLVAQRVVRVRLATGRRQFGLMAAMWRSCGNDRQKDGIARSCPLLTRISLSRCRRDQCALRHDQQFVISGRCRHGAASWVERGRAYRGRRSPAVRGPVRAPCCVRRRLDAAQPDMITALASKACGRRADQSLLLPSGLLSGVRRILFDPAADDAGFGIDEASRTETKAARQSAAMPARRCKFLTREAGGSFVLHAPRYKVRSRYKARYGRATRPS